jgi:hypothetical protein
VKTKVFEAVCSGADSARILGNLYQLELDAGLMGAMVEQLICDK